MINDWEKEAFCFLFFFIAGQFLNEQGRDPIVKMMNSLLNVTIMLVPSACRCANYMQTSMDFSPPTGRNNNKEYFHQRQLDRCIFHPVVNQWLKYRISLQTLILNSISNNFNAWKSFFIYVYVCRTKFWDPDSLLIVFLFTRRASINNSE